MATEDVYIDIQREKLIVTAADSGTGNETLLLSERARELVVSNDVATDLTVTVTTVDGATPISITLKGYEVMDERFKEFAQVDITASGAWRAYVRSGRKR